MKRLTLLALLAGCHVQEPSPRALHDLRQLTSDGTHAEAYWSPDGRKIVLMGERAGDPADQIYELDVASRVLTRISPGQGKST